MAIPQGFLGNNVPLVMTASAAVVQGDLLMTTGAIQTVIPATDAASSTFRGIANETKTASAVAGADLIDACQEGVFLLTTNASLVSVAAGTAVFVKTKNSVALTADTTNGSSANNLVGYLVRAVSTTQAYIRIRAN